MSLDCAWVRERLGGYLQFDLPDSEMPAIENHVRRCPKCSADCEQVRRVGDWLAEEFLRQRGVTSSSEERVSGIMARIEGHEIQFTELSRAAGSLLRQFPPPEPITVTRASRSGQMTRSTISAGELESLFTARSEVLRQEQSASDSSCDLTAESQKR